MDHADISAITLVYSDQPSLMEVDEEHLPIFNDALLVGSQELDDIIPDDDVNENYAGK